MAHPNGIAADFNAVAYTFYHQKLVVENRFPCGVCVNVCPIGEDRKLYKRIGGADYLREQKALAANPNDPEYAHLVHLRTHGSDGSGN